jgi:hypothetical protein
MNGGCTYPPLFPLFPSLTFHHCSITTDLSASERISKLKWWLTTVDAQLEDGDPVTRRILAVATSVTTH